MSDLPAEIQDLLTVDPLTVLPSERHAFARSTERSVSAWARTSIYLPREETSEPGSWRDERMAYCREIQDALGDAVTEQVTLMTATQISKTSIARNWLFYLVDQKPGNALVVMPREEDAVKVSVVRHLPVLLASERLARYVSPSKADNKGTMRHLGRMWVRYGGANSPASLASDPIQNLILDEIDKYPPFAGREADPISLATERTKNFPDRKIFMCSTPTTTAGLIWREWELSDKRRYHVPCPHCGAFQVLSMAQVRFDKDMPPGHIETMGLAHYECEHCHAAITDGHKTWMVQRGVWVPEACTLDADGVVHGEQDAMHKGYQLSSLYSPWVTFARMAAQFLRSKNDPGKLMNFRNSWEGWVWENVATNTTTGVIQSRQLDYERGTVPEGVVVLTAGVDVQKDLIYWSVRGWGMGERSWLIDAGRVETWAQLARILTREEWERSGKPGEKMRVRLALVDSGFRTDEVYQFCRRYAEVCRPIKGVGLAHAQVKASPVWATKVEVNLRGQKIAGGLTLWHVDSNWAKEKLARCMTAPQEDDGAWWVHRDISDEYAAQVTAEHKVRVLNRARGIWTEEWQQKPHKPANHWLDCEVYNLAAATMLHVQRLQDEEAVDDMPQSPARETPPSPSPREHPAHRQRGGWMPNSRQGWMGQGRSGWMR